jgi:hypothetical protein
MIISVVIENDFDKIQHPFMIKTSIETRNSGNVPQHNKGHIQQTYGQYHTKRGIN